MEKYRLIKLDNKQSDEQLFLGNIETLTFDGCSLYFGNLKTSRVRNISVLDDEIIVITKNSIYTFKMVNYV